MSTCQVRYFDAILDHCGDAKWNLNVYFRSLGTVRAPATFTTCCCYGSISLQKKSLTSTHPSRRHLISRTAWWQGSMNVNMKKSSSNWLHQQHIILKSSPTKSCRTDTYSLTPGIKSNCLVAPTWNQNCVMTGTFTNDSHSAPDKLVLQGFPLFHMTKGSPS